MFNIKYEVIEEIKFGKGKKIGTHLRLVKSQNGKKAVQCWSSLSKQWNIMHRYDVDTQWAAWKRTKDSIDNPKYPIKKATRKKPVVAKESVDTAKQTTKQTTRKPRKKATPPKDTVKTVVKKATRKKPAVTKEVAEVTKKPRKPRKKAVDKTTKV